MADYTESRINLAKTGISATNSWVSTDMEVGSHVKKFHIEHMDLNVTSIAGGASSFSWYLSIDAAGEFAVTPVKVGETWSDGKGTGKVYSAAIARSRSSGDRGDAIYLQIKLNAGTATVAAYIEGVRI